MSDTGSDTASADIDQLLATMRSNGLSINELLSTLTNSGIAITDSGTDSGTDSDTESETKVEVRLPFFIRRANLKRSGFMRPVGITNELADFLGVSYERQSRVTITIIMHNYIKQNNLQDLINRRNINPDKKLTTLLRHESSNITDCRKRLTKYDGRTLNFLNLQMYLQSHILPDIIYYTIRIQKAFLSRYKKRIIDILTIDYGKDITNEFISPYFKG